MLLIKLRSQRPPTSDLTRGGHQGGKSLRTICSISSLCGDASSLLLLPRGVWRGASPPPPLPSPGILPGRCRVQEDPTWQCSPTPRRRSPAHPRRTHPAPPGRLSAAARAAAASPPSRPGSSPAPGTRTCSWCACPAPAPGAAWPPPPAERATPRSQAPAHDPEETRLPQQRPQLQGHGAAILEPSRDSDISLPPPPPRLTSDPAASGCQWGGTEGRGAGLGVARGRGGGALRW